MDSTMYGLIVRLCDWILTSTMCWSVDCANTMYLEAKAMSDSGRAWSQSYWISMGSPASKMRIDLETHPTYLEIPSCSRPEARQSHGLRSMAKGNWQTVAASPASRKSLEAAPCLFRSSNCKNSLSYNTPLEW